MRLSRREDAAGANARELSDHLRDRGVFEASGKSEFIGEQVQRRTQTGKYVNGIIVDYRPPLFFVTWANGRAERFNLKELKPWLQTSHLVSVCGAPP